MIPADRDVAVPANLELPPQRYDDETEVDLMRRVITRLFDSYDLTRRDIDGVLSTPCHRNDPTTDTNVLSHELLIDELNLEPTLGETTFSGGATYNAMLHQAADAIRSGRVESVLCIGTGKYPSPKLVGQMRERTVQQEEFEYPYGTFIPAIYALQCQAHMHEYGTTKEDLAHVSMTMREWALEHSTAKMRNEGALTVDDVLDSPQIVEPYHKLHCSVPCDGGGAFLVTDGETARTMTDQPAYLLGYGEHRPHGHMSQASTFVQTGAVQSGKQAYETADLTPDDVDVAQLYDAFSSTPIQYAEDLGLAPAGEGAALFREGEAGPGGRLPINTHGGLLSYGHSSTSSGMSMVNEALHQVHGTAENQVQDAETVLVHCNGGMSSEHATSILGRHPPGA